MFKKIDKSHSIFHCEEFKNDRYKFYIALKILSSSSPIIYSNEKDYVVMQSDSNSPIWIWTKDDIDVSLCMEIIDVISKYYEKREKITCKKEFYDLLTQHCVEFIDGERYFEMGTLYCTETIKPKLCDGYMRLANMDDINVIAEYWQKDNLEMDNVNLSMDKAMTDAKEMIESGNTYVLVNDDNIIACMASYNVISDVAKINHVYTPVEERRKGYCANLIYEISNMLLDQGITPMLYTDYNYIPSNKSYMNAGYVKDGILVTFGLRNGEE